MARGPLEKLERINAALMERVERSMDQQGNAFSLFQTAIGLETRMRQRTDELAATLRRLEQSNRALNQAKEAAERANLSKTRFLAAASHDVLQPLNAAILSVSALIELQTSERGHQLVRQVEQSLSTMDELLRTLIDISKLDGGVMRPEVAPVPLGALLESLRSDFAPIAAERELALKVRPNDHFVLSDRTMLRRILQNILSNALRYTARGGVLVGARRRGGLLSVEVIDTGKGIPPDQYETVFEEFHRGLASPGADGGRPAGLGLGLAIVRRMVQALDHDLSFASQVGRGTHFRLLLPLADMAVAVAEPRRKPPADPVAHHFAETRVLVLENDRPVMQAMAALLEGWRCSARLASSSAEGFELLEEVGWTPDLVLADQHLDGGDLGLDAVELLRDRLGWQVPAIIITADPSPDIVVRASLLGAEVMRKPLKPAELRALMAHLLARKKRKRASVWHRAARR